MEPAALPISWFAGNKNRYIPFYEAIQKCTYTVLSFGPDERWQSNELYDGSNGIRSLGDLFTPVYGK